MRPASLRPCFCPCVVLAVSEARSIRLVVRAATGQARPRAPSASHVLVNSRGEPMSARVRSSNSSRSKENATQLAASVSARASALGARLHAVYAARLKLEAAPRAEAEAQVATAFGGVAGADGGLLPAEFLPIDSNQIYAKYNCRGGVEPAFMSCTKDREVALDYASAGAGNGKAGIVFELQLGMIVRLHISHSEPVLHASHSEPVLHASHSEPVLHTSHSEPVLHASHSEPVRSALEATQHRHA